MLERGDIPTDTRQRDCKKSSFAVAPMEGAWIETGTGPAAAKSCRRRTLHGCVD